MRGEADRKDIKTPEGEDAPGIESASKSWTVTIDLEGFGQGHHGFVPMARNLSGEVLLVGDLTATFEALRFVLDPPQLQSSTSYLDLLNSHISEMLAYAGTDLCLQISLGF